MWLYLLIFFIPVLLYFGTLKSGNGRSVLQLAVFLSGLAMFVGLGDMLGGYDRYIYGDVFDSIANVTNVGQSYWVNDCFEYFPSEGGWTVLNILLSFFTDNRYIFILAITLLTYTLLFISLRRYASNYPFALVLFLGLWFYFSFTYLRQVLGATLVWLAIPYIVKRNPWKFCAIVLLAWTIHKSAIIFLPVYFIAHRSFTRRQILVFMALALVAGVSPLPNALFNAYGDMSEVELQNDYSASGGLRVAYFLEAAFFLWLMMRDGAKDDSDITRRVLFNIACLFCATLLFFIRSENGGRLSWYYMIGVICTLTDIAVSRAAVKGIAQLLIVVSLVLYVRLYSSWNSYKMLYPYKTFLTNGYRVDDPIRDSYEYDHNYDYNKFYREPFRLKENFQNIWE